MILKMTEGSVCVQTYNFPKPEIATHVHLHHLPESALSLL
jgi:hypothetical protein